MSRPRSSTAKPQNKKRRRQEPYTEEEWRALPIRLDVLQVARAIGCCARWANDHAEEIGGKKVAGRWMFSKAVVARYLGME